MDTGTESRYSLIQRRENNIRKMFMESCYLVYTARLKGWNVATENFIRMTLQSECQQAQDAYNEVKELAIAIGNASKAGYTAFWLREIKRLQEDCEAEWIGKTAQERDERATGAHDDLYGEVK